MLTCLSEVGLDLRCLGDERWLCAKSLDGLGSAGCDVGSIELRLR